LPENSLAGKLQGDLMAFKGNENEGERFNLSGLNQWIEI
jgi:hypothetical protein